MFFCLETSVSYESPSFLNQILEGSKYLNSKVFTVEQIYYTIMPFSKNKTKQKITHGYCISTYLSVNSPCISL